ncbi:MAG: protein kinase domain-containing protein [Pirellulaceae bacterium]
MVERKSSSFRHLLHGTSLADDLVALSDDARQELEQFRRSHETVVLTIFFSDLVGSTKLQTELGNLRSAELVQRHYHLMRHVLTEFDGREIKTVGDSMLIVFAAPSEAVKFALYAQRAMRRERQAAAGTPIMRAGVHQGQVVLEIDRGGSDLVDVYGLQVSTAARIMDLAQGDQILLSRAVFDDARAILGPDDFPEFAALAWRNHGPYRFKGVEESHEVCEVGEEGWALLAPPASSGKGWPADVAAEELGWRPASGVVVPESNWLLSEKLGQGAFGEVWKAYNLSDKSFQVFKFCFKRDRLPALKREARLLKRLRRYAHPNIVEVYDVTEGERPPHYLEMEYVDGPALHDWLAEQPPLNERLDLVAQIAEALDTVHAAGIFHRDIKPANILLTRREDGALQAKLSDFGLGAAEDPEFLKSISASSGDGVVGTWDYIAPEIRHGERATAQSDIYGLGLTLYQIAVGDLDRPLTGDWETQLSSDVLRDDIRRCVSQEPTQRWPRAAELAQALRSHDQRQHALALEHQREEDRSRARRFRKAAMVASLAAAVLCGISGFAAFQWREATRQRDRAVAQKRLALAAISQLTHDVPLRLRSIPGALPVAREILEENMNLLDRILELEPDTHYARRERAVNLVSIGDRWLLLGDTQRALTAFQESLQITRELSEAHPEITPYRRDVALAWDRLGDTHIALGQSPEALDAYNRSMGITQELARQAPEDHQARRDMWLALDKLGRIRLQLGRTGEAAQAFAEALAIAQALSDEDPENTIARQDLAICYDRMGDLHMQQGRHEAALQAFEKSMQLARQEATSQSEDPEKLRGLSIGYDKLGSVYLKVGRVDEASQAYQQSLDIAQRLAAKEPENMQLQRDVSVGLDRLGDLCLERGKAAEALARYEAAMAVARRIAGNDASSAAAQHDLSAGLAKVGDTYLRLERVEEAEAAYRQALEIALRLSDADPRNVGVLRSVSVTHCKVGGVQLLQGEAEEAAKSFDAAIAVAARLAAADSESVQSQRDLAVCYHRAMLGYQQSGKLDRWRDASQRTVEGFARVHEATAGEPASERDLMNALRHACDGLFAFSDATPSDISTALSRARQLVKLSSEGDAGHLQILAKYEFLSGDVAGAVRTLETALATLPVNPETATERAELERELEEFRQTLSSLQQSNG